MQLLLRPVSVAFHMLLSTNIMHIQSVSSAYLPIPSSFAAQSPVDRTWVMFLDAILGNRARDSFRTYQFPDMASNAE